MKSGPKPPKEIITTELCAYGCGQIGKYLNNSGTIMCDIISSKCPAIKEKNSNKISNLHKSGKNIGWKLLPKDKRMGNLNKRFAEFGTPGKGQFKNALILERGHICENCKLSEWMGIPITIELEHIDGNTNNNTRENLKLLCPNCHSQTPTWRRRKNKYSKNRRYSDEEMIASIKISKNMNECLKRLSLSWGSGETILKIMQQYDIKFLKE